MNRLDIFIDGASSGNPGSSGIGIVMFDGGRVVKEVSRFIGNATNNTAEYTAFIHALEEAKALNAREVYINTDSELLYRQLKGMYKVKHPNIKLLFQQVKAGIAYFQKVNVSHIKRDKNTHADKLAKKAVKEASKEKLALSFN